MTAHAQRVDAGRVDGRDHAGVSRPCASEPDRTSWAGAENCNKDALSTLYPSIFIFGADQPVYPPWYIGDNPGNGEGFESALAYAVADKLDYSRDDVRWVRVPFNAALDGSVPVEAYDTNGDAKMALSTGEIDALVVDLPTAFAVANELRGGTMVGQFPSGSDDVEQFGIVLDKGSPLTRCVSWVIDGFREDGTLDQLEQRWLTGAGKAPVLS